MVCSVNAELDGDDSKKKCCIKSFDEISAEKMIRSDWADHSAHSRGGADISCSKLHSCRLSNARATTTQHKHSTELALMSPTPSCLGTGGHTGGSRYGHPRYTSAHTVGKAVGGSTAHRSTWHRSAQQTRMSPKQTHEVTNTDSMIRAQFFHCSDFLKLFFFLKKKKSF